MMNGTWRASSSASPRPTRRAWWRLRQAMAAAVCVAVIGAGCGGGGSSSASKTDSPAHRTAFRAADFVDPTTSTNRWHPLKPGTQWVRQGTTEIGSRAVPHQVVTTITDVIREIDGVKTVAMLDQDTDAGQVTQLSIDYLALDKRANVWILGGYTEDFQGGVFTNPIDAWLGAAQRGKPGILMPTDPDLSTPRWFIAKHKVEKGSEAEVVEKGKRECVEFGCFNNVLVIREGKTGAIDNEFKTYAPNVGLILNTPRRESRHKDTESLVNLKQLSVGGLAEMSAEVLRLEAHARQTEPHIFGSAPEAKRQT